MTAAIEITRRDLTTAELRKASRGTTDGRVARRMLAIALVLEGWIAGLRRRAAAWIGRPCATGFTAPMPRGWRGWNRGGSGRKPRLTPEQKAKLTAWVEAGPDPETDGVVRWRCIDLKRRIEAEFGVVVHERTVGKHLAALGCRRLSVRPEASRGRPRGTGGIPSNFREIVDRGTA